MIRNLSTNRDKTLCSDNEYANEKTVNLFVTYHDQNLRIDIKRPNSRRKCLFNRRIEFIQSPILALEGFEDFDLVVQEDNKIIFNLENPEWNIFLDVNKNICIAQPLEMLGHLYCSVKGILEISDVEASSLSVKASQLRCHGQLRVKGRLWLDIKWLDSHFPLISGENIEIWNINQDCLQRADQFHANDKLSLHWPCHTILKKSVMNPSGSLEHYFEGSGTLLADQSSKNGIFISVHETLTLGDLNNFISLESLNNNICANASAIVIAQSALLTRGNIHCYARSELQIGFLEGKQRSELICEGNISLEAGDKVLWHYARIHCKGGLTVQSSSLDDISSDILIEKNASLDVKKSLHQIDTLKSTNYFSEITSWDGAHEAYFDYGEKEVACKDPSCFIVLGSLRHVGEMKVVGSKVSYHAFYGKTPELIPYIPYQYRRTRALFGGKRKFWYGYDTPDGRYLRINQKPIPALFSVATSVLLESACVNLQGILTGVDIRLASMNEGIIGFSHANWVLPSTEMSSRSIAVQNYARPSCLFISDLTNQESVFRPKIPGFYQSPDLYPPVVIDQDLGLRQNDKQLRQQFCCEQEIQYVLKGLLNVIGRGFLTAELTHPNQIYAFLRYQADQYRKQGIKDHFDKPCIVYAEVPFEHPEGLIEEVLVPGVYLPPSWSDPRLHDGAGGIFSLGNLHIEGVSQLLSTLKITGHLSAQNNLVIRQFNRVTHEKRIVEQIHVIKDEFVRKKLFKNKRTVIERLCVTRYPQPGNTLSARKVIYEDINSLEMSGLVGLVGEGGLQSQNIGSIRETMLIEQQIKRQDHKKGLQHFVAQSLYPSVIHSKGPVRLISDDGYYDTLQIQAPQTQLIANRLILSAGPKALEAEQARQKSIDAEEGRTRKRKQKQRLIKNVFQLATTAYVSTLIVGRFVKLTTLRGAITHGAVFGSTHSIFTGKNPVLSGIEGALYSAFGYQVADYFSNSLNLIKNDFFQAVARQSLTASVVAAGQTILTGGDLLENITVSAVAQGFGQIVHVPKAPRISSPKIYEYALRTGLRSVVIAGTTLVIKRSDQFTVRLLENMLGNMAQQLGEHHGLRAVLKFQRALPKRTKPQVNLLNVGNLDVLNCGNKLSIALFHPSEPSGNSIANKPKNSHVLLGLMASLGATTTTVELCTGILRFLSDAENVIDGFTQHPSQRDSAFHQSAYRSALVVQGAQFFVTQPKEALKHVITSLFDRYRQVQQLYQAGNPLQAAYESGQVGMDSYLLFRGAHTIANNSFTPYRTSQKLQHTMKLTELSDSKPPFSEVTLVKSVLARLEPAPKPKVNTLVAWKSYKEPAQPPSSLVRLKQKMIANTQLNNVGLYLPEPLLPHEVWQVRIWETARNQYLKKWSTIDLSGTTKDIWILLADSKADAVIFDKMRPNDIAALFKEGRGVQIFSTKDGRLTNHLYKAKEAQQSLRTAITSIKTELSNTRQFNSNSTQLLHMKLSDLSKMKDLHKQLLKEAKCLEPNKFKP